MKRRSLLSALFAILIITVISHSTFAQSTAAEPRLEPDPQALAFAGNFDPSNWRSLFELAYWGSGAVGWEAAAGQFEPVLKELSDAVASMDEMARGEAVLEFMHRRFLKSYQEKQSNFDTLLSTGRFNCISSAVFYAVLGAAVGLEVGGVNTIDHAFCSVKIGDEQIDVETTNAYGFNPGTKTEFQDDFGRATGFSYVPPGNYRDRVSIDIIGLFSLLLQNRISAAESAGRYAEAVGLAVDRWVLLGGGPGKEFEDIIIRMLNYGTMFSRAGREEEALAWAEHGISVYGPHPKWNDFLDGVVNNLMIKYLRNGNTAGARSRFEELKPRLSAETSGAMNLMVSDYELVEALNAVKSGGDDSEFLALLSKSRLDGVVSAVRMRTIEVDWHLYKINQIVDKEGWGEGWHAAEKVIAETGSSPLLEKARRIYRANYRAELYNAAADAYNSRSYDEAQSLVEKAMLEFPDESIFRSLLLNIERALKQ